MSGRDQPELDDAFAAGRELLRSAVDEVRAPDPDSPAPAPSSRRSNAGTTTRRRRRRPVVPGSVLREPFDPGTGTAEPDAPIEPFDRVDATTSHDEPTTTTAEEPDAHAPEAETSAAVPPVTSERAAALQRRRRRLGLAAIVLVLAIAGTALIVTQVGGGDDAASETATPDRPVRADLRFATATSAEGVSVDRTWLLAGNRGDRFVSRISFTNDEPTPVVVTHTEVIPKSLAASVDDVRFDPEPTTIIEADPVVEYSLVVPAEGEVTARYTVAVEPEGASRQRLVAWRRAMDEEVTRRAAAATTTTTTLAPTTTTTAPPVIVPPPTSPPPLDALIVVRVVSQGVWGTFSYAGGRGSASLTTSEERNVVQSGGIAVPAGTHTMAQVSAPPGSVLLGVSCSDGDSGGSGASAVYNVAPGETVVCTWTNG